MYIGRQPPHRLTWAVTLAYFVLIGKELVGVWSIPIPDILVRRTLKVTVILTSLLPEWGWTRLLFQPGIELIYP